MERPLTDPTLEYNLRSVEENMASACARCGRQPSEVRLLAVTKTVAAERINQAIALGVKQIGENRVQEFMGKKELLQINGVGTHEQLLADNTIYREVYESQVGGADADFDKKE